MSGWRQALATARRATVVGCTTCALLLAGPYLWAWATHTAASGHVLDVFFSPEGEDRIRASVLYDFEVAADGGVQHVLGWRLADAWCRPIDDPVVNLSQALALSRWRPTAERGTGGRVFYDANDPSATAFILLPEHPALRRCYLGMILVMVSLALSLPWGKRQP